MAETVVNLCIICYGKIYRTGVNENNDVWLQMMPLRVEKPRVERAADDAVEVEGGTYLKTTDAVKKAFEKLFKIPTYKHGSLFDLYD